MVETTEPLTKNDKRLLAELFDALKMAHEQLAVACSTLGRLSSTLKSEQLLLVIKASIQPLIQMNVVAGFLEMSTTSRQLILPEDQVECVKLLMMPDLGAMP